MARHTCRTSSSSRMVMHLAAEFLGRRFQSWLVVAGGSAAAMLATAGFEPPTEKSANACITIRPLRRRCS